MVIFIRDQLNRKELSMKICGRGIFQNEGTAGTKKPTADFNLTFPTRERGMREYIRKWEERE